MCASAALSSAPAGPEPTMIPGETERLFAHHHRSALDTAAGGVFVALRLAEEGDRRDLRWLVERVGETELCRILDRHGERQLSRRSLEFWRRVLDLPSTGPIDDRARAAAEVWPR